MSLCNVDINMCNDSYSYVMNKIMDNNMIMVMGTAHSAVRGAACCGAPGSRLRQLRLQGLRPSGLRL